MLKRKLKLISLIIFQTFQIIRDIFALFEPISHVTFDDIVFATPLLCDMTFNYLNNRWIV